MAPLDAGRTVSGRHLTIGWTWGRLTVSLPSPSQDQGIYQPAGSSARHPVVLPSRRPSRPSVRHSVRLQQAEGTDCQTLRRQSVPPSVIWGRGGNPSAPTQSDGHPRSRHALRPHRLRPLELRPDLPRCGLRLPDAELVRRPGARHRLHEDARVSVRHPAPLSQEGNSRKGDKKGGAPVPSSREEEPLRQALSSDCPGHRNKKVLCQLSYGRV